MERSRRLLLALVLAGGLTILDPPALDMVRYPAALVVSWPVRFLAGFFGPEPRDAALARAEAEAQQAVIERYFPDPRLFRVFLVNEEDRHVFIVGGWEQGLATGDRVVAGGLLVGFVDRVEARWARIRALGHRDFHISGLVELPSGIPADDLQRELLLSGSGLDAMMARQGSRIDPRLLGCEVFAPEGANAEARRLIGRIDHDRRLDREVVRCAVDLESLDSLEVLGRAAGANLDGGRAVTALVLAEGGGGTEPRSWLIGRGTTDGVRIGSWVSSGGRLVGRVERLGPYSARMMALDDLDAVIPSLELDDQSALPGLWSARLAESIGVAVTRGRSRDAAMPRGLLLPIRGRLESLPRVGETLIIHVADASLALIRLGADR